MKIFVVIATYNEKDNIENLVNEILQLHIADLHVLVVDDNSPDGTAQVVMKNFGENDHIHSIVRNSERGYGSAHIAGFGEALKNGADVIISMDADFSHQPKVIPEMLAVINQGYDVVIGSRRVFGGKIIGWGVFRSTASYVAMIMTRFILGIKTRDVTTGFRAYRAGIMEKLELATITSNGYSFLEELIYRCEKAHLKIKEIPIVFNDRQLGQSKFSVKEIIKFFITIFKLRLGIK